MMSTPCKIMYCSLLFSGAAAFESNGVCKPTNSHSCKHGATDLTGGASLVQYTNHLQKASDSFTPTNHLSTPVYHMKLPAMNEASLLDTMSTESFCLQMSGNEHVTPVDIGNGEEGLIPTNLTSSDGSIFWGFQLDGGELGPHSVVCCEGRAPRPNEILKVKCQPQPPSLLQIPDKILKMTFDSTDEKTLAQAKHMVANLPPSSVIEVANMDLVLALQPATKAVLTNSGVILTFHFALTWWPSLWKVMWKEMEQWEWSTVAPTVAPTMAPKRYEVAPGLRRRYNIYGA